MKTNNIQRCIRLDWDINIVQHIVMKILFHVIEPLSTIITKGYKKMIC